MKRITRLKSERVQFRVRIARQARSLAAKAQQVLDWMEAKWTALKEIFGPGHDAK